MILGQLRMGARQAKNAPLSDKEVTNDSKKRKIVVGREIFSCAGIDCWDGGGKGGFCLICLRIRSRPKGGMDGETKKQGEKKLLSHFFSDSEKKFTGWLWEEEMWGRKSRKLLQPERRVGEMRKLCFRNKFLRKEAQRLNLFLFKAVQV